MPSSRSSCRISFDLDDTLICYQEGAPCELALPWYLSWLTHAEPLRRGARELFRRLQDDGWELWIYTTSHRSPWSVRSWLWCHGIRVSRVVNQDVHDRHFRNQPRSEAPSKNPAAFGIALHVDDSLGVQIEGKRHGFNVVVISPEDLDWVAKVTHAAENIRSSRRS